MPSKTPCDEAGQLQIVKIMRCAGACRLRGFYLWAYLVHKVCFLQVLYHYVPLHVAKRFKNLAAGMAPIFNLGQSQCLLAFVTHKSIAT